MRIIIDLRDKLEYKKGHLKNAINIPYETLMNNYREFLNKKDTYIVYCSNGLHSTRVSSVLSYLGYNVIKIDY